MECVADLNPPNRGGSFSWMLKGQPLRNGKRVNIKSEYDPLGELHTSRLMLKDLSWKDSGKVVLINILISLLFFQRKWYFNINYSMICLHLLSYKLILMFDIQSNFVIPRLAVVKKNVGLLNM